ncbi:MAG: hypothetical protein AAF203_06310 [Pseudomonadota bacterium]
MKPLFVLVCLCSITILPGCAGMFKYHPYARSVKSRPGQGGVIALRLNHRAEDQELAQSKMQRNCAGRKVAVEEEGEVVVGTLTKSNTQAHRGNKRQVGSLFGTPVLAGHDGETQTSSETTQKKEWQIKYRCKG